MLQRLKVPNILTRTPLQRFPRIASTLRRYSSPNHETQTENTLNQLQTKISTILNLVSDERNSERWIHKVLDNEVERTSSPHRMLEGVITFLVQKQQLAHAYTVFQRLTNTGFSPSNQVVSHMLVPLFADQNGPTAAVAQKIAELLQDPEYSDENLITLLRILETYQVSETTVAPIVDYYRASKPSDYVPSSRVLSRVVNSAVRVGAIEGAFDMLTRGSFEGHNNSHTSRIFYAFISILETFREVRPWDSRSVARVIDLMASRGWLVNIRIFDVLISNEVRAEHPQIALTMYSMLKSLTKTYAIRPTSHTFGSLFSLYRRLPPSTYQKHYTGESPIYISMRRLFRDLDELVMRKDNPLVPLTALLNAALRAFMRQRDYIGAFVVLESFVRYKVALDHKTYHAVMKLIVRRIWFEISGKRKQGEARWAEQFLGAPYTDIRLCEPLVNHILYLVSRSIFRSSAPMYPAHGQFRDIDNEGKYKVPTLFMMEHKYRPDPWNFHYEVVPLHRILHRAILAANPSMSLEGVSKALESAKAEMLCQSD